MQEGKQYLRLLQDGEGVKNGAEGEQQAIKEDRTGLRTRDHRVERMTSSKAKHLFNSTKPPIQKLN